MFFVFVVFVYIFSSIILLPNDKVQALPADIGKIIKPTPVIDRIIDVDVAPMITILSIDSNIVFRVF